MARPDAKPLHSAVTIAHNGGLEDLQAVPVGHEKDVGTLVASVQILQQLPQPIGHLLRRLPGGVAGDDGCDGGRASGYTSREGRTGTDALQPRSGHVAPVGSCWSRSQHSS